MIHDSVGLGLAAAILMVSKKAFLSEAWHHIFLTSGVEMGCRAARGRQKAAENRRPALEPPVGSTEKELAEPSADTGYL